MGVKDYLNDKKEERITDEKILNVLRESEAGFVGTTEVSDDERIDLKEGAVRNRLEDLEEDGRVHQKRIGHPERGNLAWYLADDERERPVSADRYWLARVCEEGRAISGNLLRIGGVVALAGMMAVMLSISADLYGIQAAFLQPSTAGSVGYALAAAGFANVAIGGGFKFGLSLTEKLVTRQASPTS
jgi:DNA-binding Lrp family transcriptional regulator